MFSCWPPPGTLVMAAETVTMRGQTLRGHGMEEGQAGRRGRSGGIKQFLSGDVKMTSENYHPAAK